MIIDAFIMSGAGNIFTVIDNRRYGFSVEDGKELAPLLCSGVSLPPTEGLMLVSASTEHDFRMEFFNPDGSHGAMCGNGGRCAVHFALEKGFLSSREGVPVTFSVLDTVYRAEASAGTVRLFFPAPVEIRPAISLVLDGIAFEAGYVNVGSDHLVIRFSDAEPLVGQDFTHFDLRQWGARLRYDARFAPQGVNVNFYQRQEDGIIRLRTYERGVEAETGACGTGAISTALIACLRRDASSPVRIVPTSGSPLSVELLPSVEHLEQLVLEGDAIILAEKEVEVPYHAWTAQ